MEGIYRLSAVMSAEGTNKPERPPFNPGAAFQSIAARGDPPPGMADAGDRSALHLGNGSGEGDIFLYRVFPGCELAYNDISMGGCVAPRGRARGAAIEISHCLSGRCERCFENRSRCCLGPGDLLVCPPPAHGTVFSFPSKRYCGISVIIEPGALPADLKRDLKLLFVDLEKIEALARGGGRGFIMRGEASVEHIFSGLYSVREERKEGYMQVKVVELLLFLSDLEERGRPAAVKYTDRRHERLMIGVRDFIAGNIGMHHTIAELSRRFGISQTVMKRAFREACGTSPYAFLRACRLQAARDLLKEEGFTVADIAAKIGYENPNKFTSAFHKFYGVSPMEYRKKCPNG